MLKKQFASLNLVLVESNNRITRRHYQVTTAFVHSNLLLFISTLIYITIVVIYLLFKIKTMLVAPLQGFSSFKLGGPGIESAKNSSI